MSCYGHRARENGADHRNRRSWRPAAAFSRERPYPKASPLETGILIFVDCLNSEIHVEGRRLALTE